MKNRIFIFLALLSLLSYKPLIAGQPDTGQPDIGIGNSLALEIKNHICMPYLKALKNGDVRTLIELSGGEIYDKYKVLLEKNSLYPQFLKDYYRGVEFVVGDLIREGDDLIVDIHLLDPNGNQSTFKIRLAETAKKSKSIRWQFVRVIH